MIGFIKGELLKTENKIALVFVNGVGYEVNIGEDIYEIDTKGKEVEFYTHTQYKENDVSLWGFVSPDELQMFKLLLNVSGIGGKTAMQLVKQKGIDNIVYAIQMNSDKDLKVTGVGPKTAKKIILELKDKVDSFAKTNIEKSTKPDNNRISNHNDVKEALVVLGYAPIDIDNAIIELGKDKELADLETQEIIKLVLKYL